MSSSKSIASGVLWSTVYNLINGIYGFISVPLLIVYFGKANYGLIGLAMSINIYLRLMDLGFNSTNVRFFSNWLAKQDFSSVRKLFQTSLAFYGSVGLLNAIILLIISYFSISIFHLNSEQDAILKTLLQILAVSAFISWFSSCFDQLIKAYEYVGWMQKITIIPKIAQILILALTIWLHFSIEWYYALTVFSTILIIPIAVRKITNIAPYISFLPVLDKQTLHTILPYCLNIFSFGIFQFSINYLRPVFLGMQGNIESVADYRILNGIIAIVLMLGGTFMSVMLPSASKVVALENRSAQNRIAYDGTKYISILLCFCCFGMMSVTREVLLLYVGSEYLYLTFWLNMWLLTTLMGHNQAISSLILSGNNIRAITYSTIVASVIGLLLCWFLIPYYGIGGTVIGYAVYGIIQILFYYLYYWPRKMGLNSWRIFRNSFCPCVTTGVIAMLIARCCILQIIPTQSPIFRIFCGGILFFCVYSLFTFFWILNSSDKNFFWGLLCKKGNK